MTEGFTNPEIMLTDREGGSLHACFSGDWLMRIGEMPDSTMLKSKISGVKKLMLELEGVREWDTSLVALLYRVLRMAEESKVEIVWKGVPEGVEELLGMALGRNGEKKAAPEEPPAMHEKLGHKALLMHEAFDRVMAFIGEVTFSGMRLARHKAYFRHQDFLEALADVGPRALPIVTLISFLVGLILAFVGSMQLQQFGAQIFIANLVGVAMTREMGAMMTGIIMAGRTGASYAARLGTMQVNEEVDALRTAGIEPMDFLVLPRVLALVVMLPVLCVYANVMGILGGMAIGVGLLDLAPVEYWNQTVEAVRLKDCWAGLIKSVVFAAVVGLAGCYHGLHCGRSSQEVGRVTTLAVVSAIVFIIITDSLLTVVYDFIGF